MIVAALTVAALAQPFAGWLERSKMPAPAGPVSVQVVSCGESPGPTSCTLSSCEGRGCPQRILIHPAHARRRDIFLHELGHAYDNTRLDDRARAWFRDDREQAASAYGLCARYRRITFNTSFVPLSAWMPTPALHRRACRVLRP